MSILLAKTKGEDIQSKMKEQTNLISLSKQDFDMLFDIRDELKMIKTILKEMNKKICLKSKKTSAPERK